MPSYRHRTWIIPDPKPHHGGPFFSTPWEEPNLGPLVLPGLSPADLTRPDRREIDEIRRVMIESFTKEAWRARPEMCKTSHLREYVPNAAIVELKTRVTSCGGKLFLSRAMGAAHQLKLLLGQRAALEMSSGVDVRNLVQALMVEELALFFALQQIPFAWPYARSTKHVEDLWQRKELRASNHDVPDTYAGFPLLKKDMLRPQEPQRKKRYGGESVNVKARGGEHDALFSEMAATREAGLWSVTKALEARMRLWYDIKTKEWWLFANTRLPSRDNKRNAEFVSMLFDWVGNRYGLSLWAFGAWRCNEGEDEWAFMLRQCRALNKHMTVAMLNCTSDGYEDDDQFAGATFESGCQGANSFEPSVGFGTIEGALASTREKVSRKLEDKADAITEAMYDRNAAPSIPWWAVNDDRSRPQHAPLGLTLYNAVNPAPPTRKLAPLPRSRESVDSWTGCARGRREHLRAISQRDPARRLSSVRRLGIEDGLGEEVANLNKDNKLDRIKYVHSLTPPRLEGATHRVHRWRHVLYRLPPLDFLKEPALRELLQRGEFPSSVKDGVFHVALGQGLPALKVSLKSRTVPGGAVTLNLRPIGSTRPRSQPKSASSEASYMVDRFGVDVKDAKGKKLKVSFGGQDVATDLGKP